jgi:hypothetical protein
VGTGSRKRLSKVEDNALKVPLQGEPGVWRMGIDSAGHVVSIDFDPRLISEEGVRQVAERLAPLGTSSIAGGSCAWMGDSVIVESPVSDD